MPGYNSPHDDGPQTIRLNRKRYRELVAARGWATQAEQAAVLGVSQQTISRMVERNLGPGLNSIAALLTTFPDETFESLFLVVPDYEALRRSA